MDDERVRARERQDAADARMAAAVEKDRQRRLSKGGPLRKIGSAELYEDRLRIGFKTYPITNDLRVSVDAFGEIEQRTRTSATRVVGGGLIAGPLGALVGAAARKGQTTDRRQLLLLFEADTWAEVVTVDPDSAAQAQRFAQEANLAARQAS